MLKNIIISTLNLSTQLDSIYINMNTYKLNGYLTLINIIGT